MSTPLPPKRERRRQQISCTECRRRKQKCDFPNEGKCRNCARRYPPVECVVQPFKDEPKSKRARTTPPYVPTQLPSLPVNIHASSSGTSSSLTSVSGQHTSQQIPVRHGHASLPGTALLPSANSAQKEDSSTQIPKRQSIPLSHILHPQSDQLIYPRYVSDTAYDVSPPSGSTVVTILGKELSEDDVEDVVPERNNSQVTNIGMKKMMYKRMAYSGSPRTVGGMIDMLNSFNTFPVKTSLRNAELFHFFHQYVAPRLCSVDGSEFHPVFAREILPWQIQSTLMPNIAILMASSSQGYLRDPMAEMNSETLIIKDHVLKLVSNFILEDFNLVGNQAMRIVIHLVIIEWWWGSTDALWFHMDGIRKMLLLRGGFAAMEDPLNANVLIVTDYELACGFETDLYFQTTEEALATKLPVREEYSTEFRCPLLDYCVTFAKSANVLRLEMEVARILDDIRDFTAVLTGPMLDDNKEAIEPWKVQSRAASMCQQIRSSLRSYFAGDDEDVFTHQTINHTILLASLVYTHCISTTTPFTQAFTPPSPLTSDIYETFITNILVVPLSKWAEIPGLFFFILLVATPASNGDYRGRFLRKQQACTGMSISLEDFLLGMAYLRSFWVVQLWIRRQGASVKVRNVGTKDVVMSA